MQKNLRILGFTLTLLVAPHFALAASLTGLSVTPNESAGSIRISWDAATTETINETDGYAIQWSTKSGDISIEKHGKQFVEFQDGPNLYLRLNSFDRNTRYYVRVYTYEMDDRSKILSNGSKMLKWQMAGNYSVTSEEITVNDPVISTNTSDDDDDDTSFDFGEIRVLPIDNFADFSWSRPTKMINSDYDGFYITIATNSTLSDVVKSFKADRTDTNTRVKGLTPATQYYVQGAFYKDTNGRIKTLGKGAVKAFKTVAAINRSLSNRTTRNLAKIEKKSYKTVQVGVDDSSATTSTTSTSASKSTTSSSTSIVTSKSSSSNIRARITAIKAEIKKLQAELARLEGTSTSTKTSTTKKTYTSSSKKSLKERLKEALAARRNK